MNQIGVRLAIAGSTIACATLLSFSWTEQRGMSLSVESAQARVGRPLTPMSGAGVARRHNRRAAYGYGYGPGAAGAGLAGAAAVGTAAAVAATSPYWGGGPYYSGANYAGGPYYQPGVLGGPYSNGGVRAANAYYAPPVASPSTASSDAVPWPSQFNCRPGALVRPGNGIIYRCW